MGTLVVCRKRPWLVWLNQYKGYKLSMICIPNRPCQFNFLCLIILLTKSIQVRKLFIESPGLPALVLENIWRKCRLYSNSSTMSVVNLFVTFIHHIYFLSRYNRWRQICFVTISVTHQFTCRVQDTYNHNVNGQVRVGVLKGRIA